MRLTHMQIENFGSIRNLSLGDLGQRVVFVGPNGTGKTFIFEALKCMFTEFEGRAGVSNYSDSDYLWFNRDVTKPIRVSVTIAPSDKDLRLWSASGIQAGRIIQNAIKSGDVSLVVDRILQHKGRWSTARLLLGSRPLVIDGQLAQRAPTALINAIQNTLRSEFVFIRQLSNSDEVEGRIVSIPGTTIRDMTHTSISRDAQKERQWQAFTHHIERVLELRLEPHSEEPLAQVSNFRVPQRNLGGGQQWASELLWQLQSRCSVIALEEPESHLHPRLLRRLIDSLGTVAPDSQFLISSHSPITIDKRVPRNNWELSIVEGQTVPKRMESVADIRSALYELGAVPSDLLFKDYVLLVEGDTEALAVVPQWASTLQVEAADIDRILIRSINGKGQLLNNLRIWLELFKDAPVEYHVMLDGDAAGDAQQAKSKLGIASTHITLMDEQAIEEYYPRDLILEALIALFQTETATSADLRQGEIVKSIETILNNKSAKGTSRQSWKIQLGGYVSSRMTADQIPDSFKAIIVQMRDHLARV